MFVACAALAAPAIVIEPVRARSAIIVDVAQAASPADVISGRWEFTYEIQAAESGRGAAGAEGRGGATGRGRAGGNVGEGASQAAPATARGRGAGGGAPAGPARIRVVMNFKPGPANTLTGSVASGSVGGRRGGTPAAVEISDGRFDGSRFSFQVWVVDGYRNRANYEGQFAGDTLRVNVSRDTPSGVEKIAEGVATRLRR